jgi:hypothetical protein
MATTPRCTTPATPMRMESSTHLQSQPQATTWTADVHVNHQTDSTTVNEVMATNVVPTTPVNAMRSMANHNSNSTHTHSQSLPLANHNQSNTLHTTSTPNHEQTTSGSEHQAQGAPRTAPAWTAASAASMTHCHTAAIATPQQQAGSPSSGTIVMNRVPVSPITPRLLACAQILSGRSLLTESDIARFGRQHFDHCAFLTEHVCANDQVAVHVQLQTLSRIECVTSNV